MDRGVVLIKSYLISLVRWIWPLFIFDYLMVKPVYDTSILNILFRVMVFPLVIITLIQSSGYFVRELTYIKMGVNFNQDSVERIMNENNHKRLLDNENQTIFGTTHPIYGNQFVIYNELESKLTGPTNSLYPLIEFFIQEKISHNVTNRILAYPSSLPIEILKNQSGTKFGEIRSTLGIKIIISTLYILFIEQILGVIYNVYDYPKYESISNQVLIWSSVSICIVICLTIIELIVYYIYKQITNHGKSLIDLWVIR